MATGEKATPPADARVHKLAEMHPGWGIDFEPPPRGPSAGAVRQPGGSGLLRYAFGDDDRGPYLEFYSFHRVWGDSHCRIYESGEVQALATLQTAIFPTGDTEKDKRQVGQQNEANRQLLEQLDAAGLLSGGPVPGSFQINAAIVTGIVDPAQPQAEG